MATYEHREGRGNSFFQKKETENQPDFAGDGMYKGELVRLALWKKKNAKGETFLSWELEPKKEKREPMDYVVTPTEDIAF